MYDTDTTASFDALSQPRQHSATSPILQVIRRNGAAVPFNPEKISIAMSKAFLAVEPGKTALYPQEHKYPEGYKSSRMREQVTALTQTVVTALMRRLPAGQPHDTPQIQFTMDGKTQPLDAAKLTEMVTEACLDLGADVSPKIVVEQAVRDFYDGISFNEVRRALIL